MRLYNLIYANKLIKESKFIKGDKKVELFTEGRLTELL